MVEIPDRENLEEMSRTDIQKLCKDNNIKANMRTDEMINALCDLANGMDVPRPHRAMSERAPSQPLPKSRVPSHTTRSAKSPSKVPDSTSIKKALQPSESNTDAESVASVVEAPASVSAPTTRRKAKDIQTHLGKGRPAVAGGSGARNITKSVSRGVGRRAKASAMLQQDPIPEEDEENVVVDTNPEPEKVARPSSTRPQSQAPSGSHDPPPSQLPTPAPSQPSHSFPSVHFSALETRIAQLEHPNLTARLSQIEASMAELPALRASMAELPALRASVAQIPALQARLEETSASVDRCTRANVELQARTTGLEAQVAGLVTENGVLKDQLAGLEAQLRDRRDASTGSIIIHSPEREQDSSEENIKITRSASKRPAVTPPRVASANPSPSQPTLGKRHRSETPDVADGTQTQQQRADTELDAIHRVTRPQRKKARLELDADEDGQGALALFQPGLSRGGPSSTSTPRHPSSTSTPPRRSASPPSFFTAGKRAPTPLARREREKDDMDTYLHLSSEGEHAIAGPSTTAHTTSSADEPVRTPPPSTRTPAVHDPGFFGSPPPIFFTHDGELPYPLHTHVHPSTPPNPQDILEFSTPVLGEPWKYSDSGYVNPANISQIAENVGLRMGAAGPAAGVGAGAGHTFRAGGRRERNDKYNPYFTPGRQRTGLTPSRGVSGALRSPAKVEEGDGEGEGVVEGTLRTLYGTELEGDTRFGDYGAGLGGREWGKYGAR